MRGQVFLVGAGPGDPGLITKRGSQVLASADVVVVDALVNPQLFRSLKARVIFVGKRGPGATGGRSLAMPQSAINRLLVRLAKQGKRVVRLKGGDPFVFGRGGEEFEALARARLRCEVIPGVSSVTGVPTFAGIPLTDRRFTSQVTFITGQSQEDDGIRAPRVDWASLSSRQTLVVLMGVSQWPLIAKRLLREGWPRNKPVAAIEWGTTPSERVLPTTLSKSTQAFQKWRLTAPAVIVVGDVVRLRERFLRNNTQRPLVGKRIVVTRPLKQSIQLVAELKKRGAEVLLCPALQIEPLRSRIKLKVSKYDWLVFLSANAVRTFPRKVSASVLAVGPETKRVAEKRGWRVKATPKKFNSTGVLAALGMVRNKRILIPRVQSAPKDLVAALHRRGAIVEQVITYRTRPIRIVSRMKKKLLNGVDAVTFTSSSTIDNFFKSFRVSEGKRIFGRAIACSIGPQTTATLEQNDVPGIVEAKNATVQHLVEALCRHFQS